MVKSSFESSVPQQGKRVLVVGATGFLGYRVVRALLDEGAVVTALVPPKTIDQLGALASRVHIVESDVWNSASLKGRARNQAAVVHLVGGLKPDPMRGVTFRHLNFLSARNTMQMAVSDGVPHYIFLSANYAPIGVSSEYIVSKREAETYLRKTGLGWTIVRAPSLFIPGQARHPLYMLISALSRIPLLGWAFLPISPLAVDTAARGIANLAITANANDERLIVPGQLRYLGRQVERRLSRTASNAPTFIKPKDADDDEPPFGWLPPPLR